MKNTYRTILVLLITFVSSHCHAQLSTFYSSYYDENKRDYTFQTEAEMDRFFVETTGTGYAMGYTKTYTNVTKDKKDVMYVQGAGEQDSFYVFYYDNEEEAYTLVASGFYSDFYFSPRRKTLTYTQTGCCGESNMQGNIVLQLDNEGAHVLENYAIVSLSIPESDIQNTELFFEAKRGVVQNEAYNLRIYPSMGNKYPESDTFYNPFSDNLLGKIKKDTEVKIIGKRDAEERTWYYVEVEARDLSTDSVSTSLYNDTQNIRGWVSANFVTLH